jgi:hypothetical protein
LGPNERLLWSGRPRGGVRFRFPDLFLIPFFLVWAGIPASAAIGILRSGRGNPVEILFFVPFLVIGFYGLVGRFVVDAVRRRRTCYALTDSRILIQLDFLGSYTRSIELDSLGDVTRKEHRDGSGSIVFGGVVAKPAWWEADWFYARGGNVPAEFELIEDVDQVYEQIRAARRQKAAVGHE